MEGSCNNCGKPYVQVVGFDKRPYNGGNLIVTEVPMSRCSCDSLMLLGDGVIISYYAKTLGLRDVFGDITVSLMELKKCYTVPEIMEILADQAEQPRT